MVAEKFPAEFVLGVCDCLGLEELAGFLCLGVEGVLDGLCADEDLGGGDAADDVVPGRGGSETFRAEELGCCLADALRAEVVAAHWGLVWMWERVVLGG